MQLHLCKPVLGVVWMQYGRSGRTQMKDYKLLRFIIFWYPVHHPYGFQWWGKDQNTPKSTRKGLQVGANR